MTNLFDPLFNGLSGIEMYRSWLIPDLFPDQRPARLENWSEMDIEMYVGKATD